MMGSSMPNNSCKVDTSDLSSLSRGTAEPRSREPLPDLPVGFRVAEQVEVMGSVEDPAPGLRQGQAQARIFMTAQGAVQGHESVAGQRTAKASRGPSLRGGHRVALHVIWQREQP